MSYRIALAGNPNSGKTTLFNELTGARGHVGNWPGVTVEKKEGKIRNIKEDILLVDLPGIYSLSPYSAEEVVARNYLVKESPDLIINIIDATNIERNLYLTLQLLETGVPVIIALNMMDAVKARGDKIETGIIADVLKVPVVAISASKGEGIDELLGSIRVMQHKKGGSREAYGTIYDSAIKSAISNVSKIIPGGIAEVKKDWYAIKLLEEDDLVKKELLLNESQINKVWSFVKHLNEHYGNEVEIAIADQRYKYIEKITHKAVFKNEKGLSESVSDKIDRVLTNKFLALPVFLIVMLLVFQVTFSWIGQPLNDLLSNFISYSIMPAAASILKSAGASAWAVSLVTDGVLAGLGAVLTFIPQIALMYFFLGILEDTGYMARAAFIMDRLLRKIGLSGRSFVPMLMGFGCSVPAIMAARTLENERDRKITIILTPFMSCGAKMPVYATFIGAFFARSRGLVIFSIYIIGILVAILSGFILKRVIFKGKMSTFVMELPPYRLPTFKALTGRIWQQLKHFIARAGTILLGATIAVWFLQSFDFSLKMVSDSSQSILSALGKGIAPIFQPLGFGNWKASVALLTGIVAKESVISTLGVLYKADGVSLVTSLQGVFTPLTAYAYMIFVLLYIPCVAAFSTARKEMNSWKWAISAGLYQTGLAWLAAFLIYQAGRLFV